jgi:hypothetical protein
MPFFKIIVIDQESPLFFWLAVFAGEPQRFRILREEKKDIEPRLPLPSYLKSA